MKRLNFFLIVFANLPLALSAAEQLYTCGMHPSVIRNAPGNCPICGMTLTPIRDNASSAMSGQIAINPATIQRMNIKTALVETGPVRREIRAVGTVDFDESRIVEITTKYEGWIERLFVDTTWTEVQTGDPLFEIYSPELYNAQLNYLVARRNEGDTRGPLTRAATDRLKLFDVTPEFMEQLAKTGTVERNFTFKTPSHGFVIEKSAVQGSMLKPGEMVYRLADMSQVWVLAQIYESDLPFVRVGQEAEIRVSFGSEKTFAGRVVLLIPQVTATTRTAVARIVVDNPDGELRPGMFADIRLDVELVESAVLVPDTAVLRSGEHNTVFIALDGGMFEPREVTIGPRTIGDRYQVLNGLADGERVVISGQFLLDSESQLREAIDKMRRGEGGGAPPGHNHGAISEEPSMGVVQPVTDTSSASDPTLYTCPMAIHAHVVSDQPGSCGECAMTLVPTSTVEHGPESEAAWREQQAQVDHAH